MIFNHCGIVSTFKSTRVFASSCKNSAGPARVFAEPALEELILNQKERDFFVTISKMSRMSNALDYYEFARLRILLFRHLIKLRSFLLLSNLSHNISKK